MTVLRLPSRAAAARALLLSAISSALLGCGNSASDGTRSGGARDSGVDEGCPATCDAALAMQSNGQVPWQCDAEALCDEVTFEAPPGFNITTVDVVTSVESARCALRALRDGRVGLVSWGAGARSSPGVSRATKLTVRPERIALSVEFQAMDISTRTTYGYARLQEPAYFESCVQASEPQALFDCLNRADDVACSAP
jgi:hypothetical protein